MSCQRGDTIPVVAWVALRKHQPDLTLEEIRDEWIIDDVIEIITVSDRMDDVVARPEEGEEPSADKTKAQA